MCPSGCNTLVYLGESHIDNCKVGRCVKCGAIHHGYPCNWRTRFDPTHGIVLRAVGLRLPSRPARRRTASPPRPQLDVDLIAEISEGGKDLNKLIAQLKLMGVHVQ